MYFASLALCLLALAAAAPAPAPERRLSLSPYAPRKATCPSSFVRPGSALSSQEEAYISQRKPVASGALSAWLSSVSSSFSNVSVPTLALATSGGGLRSMLAGAGVVKGLDARDAPASSTVRGLYQALTYHAGLSGGSWLVSSLAGNGWITVSDIVANQWSEALDDSIFLSDFSIFDPTLVLIAKDVIAKRIAGFDIVLDDIWGRLLSQTFLIGYDGQPGTTFSGVAKGSNFSSANVPFPIITTIQVDNPTGPGGSCIPPAGATQFEITPFDFGSWDMEVSAFAPTMYLGTAGKDGKPTGSCYTGFDNLGYILGTSSNLFNELCSPSALGDELPIPPVIKEIYEFITGEKNFTLPLADEYATYPNPFEDSPVPGTEPGVNDATVLSLVDGGETGQNDPIWPFLQQARSVDVLIVNDNSADTDENFPDGSEVYHTYERAQQAGLTKMPTIPDPASARWADGTPKFFGCNQIEAITLVYVPNAAFVYPSNQSTAKLQYSPDETAGMISNGVEVANFNGDKDWGFCLGCAIVAKVADVAGECGTCLDKYCVS